MNKISVAYNRDVFLLLFFRQLSRDTQVHHRCIVALIDLNFDFD